MTAREQDIRRRWADSYTPIRDTGDPEYNEAWYFEQCGGCRAYLPLPEPLGDDWGACTNSESPADGTLRFEHDGCEAFEPDESGQKPFA